MDTITEILRVLTMVAPGFLIAITVHEYAHGYVALRLGDPTARLAGRLTFNPISHLDPVGAIVLVLTQTIGWAKPVPVDPRYLRHPRQDMMWISLAGPVANIIAAVGIALVFHLLGWVFDLRWIDRQSLLYAVVTILLLGVKINVLLAFFNLIPIPPLDGSKILAGLLPRDMAHAYEQLEPYGFIILILLLLLGPQVGLDVVKLLVLPPANFLYTLLIHH